MKLKYLDRLDSLNLRRRPVYEPEETAIVKRELQPGQTFLDIGAHIGYYALMASKLVGDQGIVFTFEPAIDNFNILEKNVKAVQAKNVFLFNQAVSNKTGMDILYLNPKNSGDNRLFNPGQVWKKTTVRTVRLDDLFSCYSGKIDFIKIDTQGHELSIIYGAEAILERFNRMKMLVEYYPIGLKQNGYDPWQLIKELKGLGFKIEYPSIETIKHCLPENGKHCNLFCRR